MITVKIDDKSPAGKRIIKDLRRHRRAVNFVEHNEVPKGYLMGNEFVRECKAFVTECYQKKVYYSVTAMADFKQIFGGLLPGKSIINS